LSGSIKSKRERAPRSTTLTPHGKHGKPRPQQDEDDLPKVKISAQTAARGGWLYTYLWPYRYRFVAALAALLGTSLAALAFPYVAGKLVDRASRAVAAEGP